MPQSCRNNLFFQAARKSIIVLLIVFVSTRVTVGAELKIWVKAFIPKYHPTNQNYVLPRPGHSGEYMIPDPIESGVCFATDNRSFSSDQRASARMTSTITLMLSGGNLSQNQSHQVGETRVFWCADGTEKHPPKSAKTSRMYWGTPAHADGNIQVTLEGNANNPHVVGSPSIYYAGDFMFDSRKKKLRYKLTFGRFPAFEVYAQLDSGQVVKLINENPADGTDVWSLISIGGIGTRSASGEVNF